jgi:hypothetical protein
MTRETWVFPSNGGAPYLRGEEHGRAIGGVTILPDLPDFVSPVDGKRYSGRAGMREHNRINNVVPNAELKGLPYLQSNSDQRTPEQRRASDEHRKQTIINQVQQRWR